MSHIVSANKSYYIGESLRTVKQRISEHINDIYNGKNLANVYASAANTYVATIMRTLFTQKELFSELMIKENKSTKSLRIPLDLAKVQLLKG